MDVGHTLGQEGPQRRHVALEGGGDTRLVRLPDFGLPSVGRPGRAREEQSAPRPSERRIMVFLL